MLSIKNKKWCQLVIFLFVFYGISNGRLLAKEQQASFKLAIVQPIYKSISVKQAPDKHAKTLGQIEQDILIHCVPDMMSDWWWVSQGGIIYSEKEKNPSFQGKGYINKQEINLIDDWSHTAQHQYICNILNQYQAILEKYLLSQNRLGSIADKDMSKIQDTYHELQYIPILPYVENLVIN